VQHRVLGPGGFEVLLQRVGRLAGDEQFPLRIADAAADLLARLRLGRGRVVHHLRRLADLARRLPGLFLLELGTGVRRGIPVRHLVQGLDHKRQAVLGSASTVYAPVSARGDSAAGQRARCL
jgi:hypothetical protein